MSDSLSKLTAALKAQRAVFVLGAGVAAATLPGTVAGSWELLLASAKEYLPDDTQALLEFHLERDDTPQNLIHAAQMIKDWLGDNYGRWLSKTFSSLAPADTSLLSAIEAFDLPIFTTNYDKLIESSLGTGSATWEQPDKMYNVFHRISRDVGHLHGVYDEPNSVIFSADEYSRVINDQGSKQLLGAMFTGMNIIFVGVGKSASDPNFGGLLGQFERIFPSANAAHFRLCLTSELDQTSSLGTIQDVAYGQTHGELPDFLNKLHADVFGEGSDAEARAVVRVRETEILTQLCDQSLLPADQVGDRVLLLDSLVVSPIFLSKPHSQFTRAQVLNNDSSRPLKAEDVLGMNASIILVAGEEGAGVSTAVQWLTLEAARQEGGVVPFLIRDALSINNQYPISVRIRNQLSDKVPSDSLILGIDDLQVSKSKRYLNTVNDIGSSRAQVVIVGTREQDAAGLEADLRATCSEARKIETVYLGRFGVDEAREIAVLVDAQDPDLLAKQIVSLAKANGLPRTPQTFILIARLLQAGKDLNEVRSSDGILDKFLNLLLDEDTPGPPDFSGLNTRQKMTLLSEFAGHLVKNNTTVLPRTQAIQVLEQTVMAFDWEGVELQALLSFLKLRRIITMRDEEIRFTRSAYLLHFAATQALDDHDLRQHMFKDPLRYARIWKSLATLSRRDKELLQVCIKELDALEVNSRPGKLLSAIHSFEAGTSAFTESEEETQEEEIDESGDLIHLDYDMHDDSDHSLLFVDSSTLPAWKRAMLMVDWTSKVLRDSDEVRDQQLKQELLDRVLKHWLIFLELFEEDLDIHFTPEIIAEMLETTDLDKRKEEATEIQEALTLILPGILMVSGIISCLSTPSLVGRLQNVSPEKTREEQMTGIVRTVALFGAGGDAWIDSHIKLAPEAKKTYFAAVILDELARYWYITQEEVSPEQKDELIEIIGYAQSLRVKPSSEASRKRSLSMLKQKLDKKRLLHHQRSKSQPQ